MTDAPLVPNLAAELRDSLNRLVRGPGTWEMGEPGGPLSRKCPYCDAEPGQPCVMAKGLMQTTHYARDDGTDSAAAEPVTHWTPEEEFYAECGSDGNEGDTGTLSSARVTCPACRALIDQERS